MATNDTTFQDRVRPWMLSCFGEQVSADTRERSHRFLEEALELVQSLGCTAGEAQRLVDYVFARPVGETGQEVGGVAVTLAALCSAAGRDMEADAEAELARIWTKVDAIRAKRATKLAYSPLPTGGAGGTGAKGAEDMGEYFDIVCHTCRERYRPHGACKLREIALNPETAASVGHFATLHPGHHLELRGDEHNRDPSFPSDVADSYEPAVPAEGTGG